MHTHTYILIFASAIALCGCGGGKEEESIAPAPAPNTAAVSMAPVASVQTTVTTPPTDTAPAAMNTADPLENIKQSRDGSPNKSDLEALQAVVDGYSFGTDGLGAPPLNSLDELVAKKVLRKIPEPPPGKKWAYDSAKWKVSLVDK